MTRILLITDADVFAGTERHVLDLAGGLRDRGERVAVGCPAGTPLAERAEMAGLEVLAAEKRGAVDGRLVRQLAQMLRSGEIALIHAHNGRTALHAAMAKSLAGRGTVIMTQHFITPSRASRRGVKAVVSGAMHRWMGRRLDHVVAISTAVRKAALERGDIDTDRISVVHNGIADPAIESLSGRESVRQELGVPEASPLIVCAARLQPEKDVATLIEAMQRLVASQPEVRCVIAGRGSQEAELRQLVAALDLSEHVRLLGFREDVRSIIAAGDVFVLPAKAEPFGLVLLEAMALRRPVVATRAGGPLDVVDDGETGILVEPSDADAMASAVEQLLKDSDLRERMGNAGRQRYEARFTVDRMAADMIAVYDRVLGRTGAKVQPACASC